MKNKAFTLVELLAVVALLAIVAAIAFPFVQDSIEESRENTYKEQVRTIEYAAKRWATDNFTQIKQETTYKSISFLKQNGYLTSNQDTKDPRDNSEMKGCVKITIINNDKEKTEDYEYIKDGCPENQTN